MPFQSEKQRRYLWANEPEIARDWTNRYGAANGGIMHQFENYAHDDGNNVSVPRSFQARPHSDQVNLAYITPQEQGILQALKPDTPHEGPMGIPNYDSFDAAGNYTSGATMSGMETGAKNERSRADRRAAGISPQEAQDIRSSAINAGAGQVVNRGWFGPKYNQTVGVGDIAAAKAFRNNPNNRFAKQAYRNTRGSNFGIGNLLRGAMSIFGGVPGSMMSMLSRIDPRQLRGWNEEEGRYNTQKEYEDARTNRRRQSRLDNLYRRKSLGKGFSQKNIDMLEAMGLKPRTAQNVLTGRDLNLRGKELTNKLSANNYDWNKRIATHSSMHPYHTEITPAGWSMMENAGQKPRGWIENLQSKFGSEIRPAAAVKSDFLKQQSWYNSPLKLRQNTFSTALGENAQEKMQAFQELKSLVPRGTLTVEKYLDLAQQNKIPSIIAEDMNKQVLEAIKEQGGFGDTFPKNYSFGNIEPTIEDGRIDIDETKIDDDYKDRLKYLEVAEGGLASLWPR